MSGKPSTEEAWREMLTGTMPGLIRAKRMIRHVPSSPRCKLCNAPFAPPGSYLMKLLRGGPSRLNRRLCRWCIPSLHKHPGGAEVEISVLFADVRGSTGLAERIGPEEFSRLIARFYSATAKAIDHREGIVDKFVGDAAVALFIPGFAGAGHAAAAIAAARDILRATGSDGPNPWIPVGVAVHTGISFVGTVGEGDAIDFTALGDTVNATARLSGEAAAGEIIVSEPAARHAQLDTAALEHKTFDLRGREQLLEAWVVRAGERSAVAA